MRVGRAVPGGHLQGCKGISPMPASPLEPHKEVQIGVWPGNERGCTSLNPHPKLPPPSLKPTQLNSTQPSHLATSKQFPRSARSASLTNVSSPSSICARGSPPDLRGK